MITVSYHDTVNVLHDLCHQADDGVVSSPFERAEWFHLLVEAGLKPLIVIAKEDDRSAALVLKAGTGHLTPLCNWYSFTWRERAPLGDLGDRLLLEIARSLKARGHRVTLEPIPDENGSATRLAKAFKAAGWMVASEPCDLNHILHVRGRSFAEYWAERPGKMRTTLKRKAKKVRVEILDTFDKAAWTNYEAIYAASWKPEEDEPGMLREFARAEGNAGRLRLGLAYEGETAVAAQCWTVENGCAYIHKLAHLESRKQLSAGTTLTAALFERVIDQDQVELVDFGTGDQLYKADWMGETRHRYRVDCLDPRQPKAWSALAKRLVRQTTARLAKREAQS